MGRPSLVLIFFSCSRIRCLSFYIHDTDMGGIGSALPSISSEPSTASSNGEGGGGGGSLALVEGFSLDPDTFQSLWSSLPDCGTFNVQLTRLPTGTAELEGALASRCIMTLASGDLPDMMKLFLYAQVQGGDRYLVQALVHKGIKQLDITLKTEAKGGLGIDPVEPFVDQISQALFALGMIR